MKNLIVKHTCRSDNGAIQWLVVLTEPSPGAALLWGEGGLGEAVPQRSEEKEAVRGQGQRTVWGNTLRDMEK